MSSATSTLKTPLADTHIEFGARMAEFAGWLMPIQYKGIIEEHQAVRTAAGLFDISHMGQLEITGTSCEAWLNSLLTNDVRLLSPGSGQYTLMLNAQGGVIDDLIIYRLDDQKFFLVVNASKTEECLNWMNERVGTNVFFKDLSKEYGGLALQGPKAIDVLKKSFPEEIRLPKKNEIKKWKFGKSEVLVAGTGYTGEEGVELFIPTKETKTLWEKILTVGKAFGCQPVGLGARDTLRLEACYPLNGNELNPTITPLEAGLKHFVAFDKPEKFNGREALLNQRNQGLNRKIVAFEITGSGAPPRSHYPVYSNDKKIGEVTSGTMSPSLKKGIGLAMIETPHTKIGTPIEIEIREKRIPAVVVKKPFYKSKSS